MNSIVSATSIKYDNPPLVEAVLEIRFECDNWKTKVVFDFYSLLKDSYTDITNRPPVHDLVVNPDGSTRVIENPLVQFWDSKRSNLIQISNGLLTINCLPEYGGWASYKSKIVSAIDNLSKVITIKKIVRLDFRVVNKIDIESHSIENFKKYFKVYPTSPVHIFDNTTSIQLQIETKEQGENAFLLTMNTTIKEVGYSAPVLFQLVYVKLSVINISDIDSWLEAAHKKLGKVFESILTDQAKRTFKK